VASIPLLGVILETLLRSHDFECFEALVGLLVGSQLPRREQRELLATMYLQYGFLSSAAQEWMAVCEAGGDGRAFLGLARVAEANGQSEDALVFAAEAAQHDPANREVQDFLSRLRAAELTPA
jgi:hypothetical protein